MTIKMLSIGRTSDPLIKDLLKKYIDRLEHYVKFEEEYIPDLKNARNLGPEQQKKLEGELLSARIRTSEFLVVLDEKGKQYTSEGFAQFIQKRLNSGVKQVTFLIGGPYGVSQEVLDRADLSLSLSKMTFSHQMVRPFFIEQLYRAFTILRNEPYHHS